MATAGISSIIFGFMYESFFLTEGFLKVRYLSPVENLPLIIEIALVFGLIQLTISLVLNILDLIGRGNLREAVFSGKGMVGLIYYLIGVVLAIRLIQGGLQLSLFIAPENIAFTTSALASLVIVFASSTIRGLGHKFPIRETVTEGFGEFKVFLITNSLSFSYLRLAAFAIAHGIFVGFAVQLAAWVYTKIYSCQFYGYTDT